MKTSIQEYFQYTKSERKGIYFLSSLFIASTLFYINLNVFVGPNPNQQSDLNKAFDFLQESDKEVNSHSQKTTLDKNPSFTIKTKTKHYESQKEITKSPLAEAKKSKPKYTSSNYPSYKTIKPFAFDPNDVSKDDLKKMNLSFAIINTLDKYRNKGGQFKSKEDLKKIYGLTDSIYAILEEFIQLKRKEEADPYIKSKPLATISFFDINTSSAEELQSLKGIGPVLSTRIVKFRDKLGGFHSIDQVKSTYGLEDSVFQSIKPFLQIQTAAKKININEADFKTINSHPYISFQLAKIIIRYREQHGLFQELTDLKNIKVLSEDKFNEIEPYLRL